jgi:hypothetical protein
MSTLIAAAAAILEPLRNPTNISLSQSKAVSEDPPQTALEIRPFDIP